ncbi:MAG TPA: sulfatase-like hydrolase/transferase [Planctomycetota bacterium]|nr:sulfatase-like hydrolase/transferase [Planctomycetota bacterium]
MRRGRGPSRACRGILIFPVLVLPLLGLACRRSPPPWSLLLVTIDTLRPDHLGCYGSPGARTPVLDGLAREGVLFETAISPVPLTLPAHVSLLSGRLPPGHGVRVNGQRVPESLPTLASVLADRGYATAAFVGAAIVGTGTGLQRGFARFDREFILSAPGARAERRAGEVNAAALEWADGLAGRRPYFAWVHYYDPHDPYEPPAPLDAAFRGREYEGEIAYVDGCLGELLAGFRARGLLERTLLVVTSDHGEGLGDHGERTHGFLLYDATVRVPLLFHAPGELRPLRVAGQARLVDVYPTCLEWLGVDPGGPVDGESLLPALRTGALGERPAYLETDHPFHAYRWAWLRGIRTERAKFVDAVEPELYDLAADPGETRNLFDPSTPPSGLVAALQRLERASPAAATAPPPATGEAEAALRSLGYAGAGPSSRPALRPPRNPKDRLWIDDGILAAAASASRGDRAGALAALARLEEADPTNPEIPFRRATLLREEESSGPAVESALLRVVELHSTWARPRAMLADLAEARGDAEAAGRWLDEALRLDPENNGLRIRSAVRLALAGREAEAEALFRKVHAQRPGLLESYARREERNLAGRSDPGGVVLRRVLERVLRGP